MSASRPSRCTRHTYTLPESIKKKRLHRFWLYWENNNNLDLITVLRYKLELYMNTEEIDNWEEKGIW